ncbi:MAG: elongation factor P [Deltaproteobacteria bacterium]|jgi:elongation factor P|nr:elongation factor P [Deltaproteobacteria bacterium]
MYSTSDFRNGLKVLIDNKPYEIIYFQHVKPGKGGAFVRTKLKNLRDGSIVEKTFRSSEKVGKAEFSDVEMQFLYSDDNFHFMDTETFEQILLPANIVGDNKFFLKENMLVKILMMGGEVLNIDLPAFVTLKITHCEPGIKGDTVSGATKPAVLETGAKIMVPLFVNEGETIKIDTRTKAYVERVN